MESPGGKALLKVSTEGGKLDAGNAEREDVNGLPNFGGPAVVGICH